MVRSLTEHDFCGSDPQPQNRIRLVDTLTGFDGDDPGQYLDWFRDGRGIPKWWNPATFTVHPQRTEPQWTLTCQVGFVARFDRPSLEVETVRYFHDEQVMCSTMRSSCAHDAVGDPFDDTESCRRHPKHGEEIRQDDRGRLVAEITKRAGKAGAENRGLM